jgi:hypothetical protein
MHGLRSRWLPVFGVLVGLAWFQAPAKATLTLTLTETNAGEQDVDTFTDAGTPGMITLTNQSVLNGEFRITVLATFVGGNPAVLTDAISALKERGDDGNGTDSLTISLVETGVTMPSTHLNIFSKVTNNAATNPLHPDTFASSAGGFNQTALSVPNHGLTNQSNSDSFHSGSPLTISNLFTITSGNAESFALTGVTQVSAVPEPATVAGALAGVPLVLLLGWMRKRRTAA